MNEDSGVVVMIVRIAVYCVVIWTRVCETNVTDYQWLRASQHQSDNIMNQSM